MRQYVFELILTATLTLALSWAVWRLSLRYKLYPGIRERDVHTTPTPRLGGIAMYLAMMTALVVSQANPYFELVWVDPALMWSIVGASTLIVVVGVADDLWDLDWMIKLAAQFLAAGIIAIGGGLQIYALPLGDLTVWSSWVSIVLTMFSIVIVMNAVNFIDGLDGLVAGTCLIANGIFFVYSYILVRDTGASTNFNLATLLAVVLIGACAGFLPMNWNGAKLFMGDAGALLLGLLMATSAIAITGQLEPAMLDPETIGRSQLVGAFLPILLPLVIVLLPLADFGLAVVRRLAAGKSPFSADRKHLHHRMLDMGHSDRGAVLIFYAWTTIVGLAVLLMYLGAREDWPGEYRLGILFGAVGVVACVVVTLLPPRRNRPRRESATADSAAP
ncbi:MraY family glycosyltransferase [Microbacterium halophytorum]|uniref:MraY family glycosyltransferase n=1 Tax=Microbacterium halophytorum TaxID=2067568 RepID=UPI000CFC26E0|nr:MraY family glycosyltransferase [Microbacterium halophytorum]